MGSRKDSVTIEKRIPISRFRAKTFESTFLAES